MRGCEGVLDRARRRAGRQRRLVSDPASAGEQQSRRCSSTFAGPAHLPRRAFPRSTDAAGAPFVNYERGRATGVIPTRGPAGPMA